MTDYINRDRLLKQAVDCTKLAQQQPHLMVVDLSCVLEAPSEDVQEVVRCKDCVYWTEEGRCEPMENGLTLGYISGVDFCSYGEKRGEG